MLAPYTHGDQSIKNTAFLALGSNEGDRKTFLADAIEQINRECGEVVRQSGIYETAAWGLAEQPDFLNMAIEVETSLDAHQLLTAIQAIEKSSGRQRLRKWDQRTLDIDILLFNQQVINQPDLVVPHPFLHERRFTLVPLAEIAPNYKHPLLHKTIVELLHDCPDKLEVHKIG